MGAGGSEHQQLGHDAYNAALPDSTLTVAAASIPGHGLTSVKTVCACAAY